MTLSARDVRWSAGGRLIVAGVDVDVTPRRLVGVLGPNGSGKSSLLRCLAGLVRPDGGVVHLGDDEIRSLRRRTIAQRLAFVEQDAAIDVPLTVLEVVLLGRTPHRRLLESDNEHDRRLSAQALQATGVAHLADRLWPTLSGGERQRVRIARAMVQQPSVLLLDEPTNHLDIAHQLEILRLVRQSGIATLAALHDLNLAAMFCDALIVLDAGRIVAAGSPAEVLTIELVRDVYGVACLVAPEPATGRPVITYLAPVDQLG